MKMKYVAGFMYSEDEQQVALIKKIKPDWQKGLLNGIGGKIEKGENPMDAMIREFKEETGYDSLYIDFTWRCFCILEARWGTVHFFRVNGDLSRLKTMEEEEVGIYNVRDIYNLKTIPNLNWLVPLGIDERQSGGVVKELQSGTELINR